MLGAQACNHLFTLGNAISIAISCLLALALSIAALGLRALHKFCHKINETAHSQQRNRTSLAVDLPCVVAGSKVLSGRLSEAAMAERRRSASPVSPNCLRLR